MTDLTSAVKDMETRLAHQEKTIADLSEMVTSQWRKIEMLERQLRHLNEELQALDSSAVPIDKPPHY